MLYIQRYVYLRTNISQLTSSQYTLPLVQPPIPPPPRHLTPPDNRIPQYRGPAISNHPALVQPVPSVIPHPSLPNFPRHLGASPRVNATSHDSAPASNVDAGSSRNNATQPGFEHQEIVTPPVPSLLDEDTPIVQPVHQAPPRPPNPELLQLQARIQDKVESEMNSLSHALALDAERLRALQADLLAGEPAIKDEMARLEAVRDVCRNVSSRLRGTVNQAEKNIAELRRRGDPEIDEMVCATSIVHNQLSSKFSHMVDMFTRIPQTHQSSRRGQCC